MAGDADSDFGLYVHIPYCVKKCPYCDFNSYAVDHDPNAAKGGRRREVDEQRYGEALCAELRAYAARSEWTGRHVRTVFFGGGTPSLFSPETIGSVLEELRRQFPVREDAEITLEANPGTVQEALGAEKLRGFRDAGVNRISMGVQSFSADKLRFLGRIHAADDVLHAADNVRGAGFENFNLDLMFGVAGETLAEWQADLERGLAFGSPHLSVYCLTIEPGTEFGTRVRHGATLQADEDALADMFSFTQERLAAAGLEQYEISNYARPGRACAHNIGYWSGRDYLGLGAGAHSFLRLPLASTGQEDRALRWSNVPGPELYSTRALEGGQAIQRRDAIDRETARIEFFFLGLRTKDGISRREFRRHFGESLEPRYDAVIAELAQLALLEPSGDNLRLTRRGFLFADGVMARFAQT